VSSDVTDQALSQKPEHAGGARELVAVLLVAACLRSAITAVGPLLGRIGLDTGLSDTALGLLSALPLLAFALVSPIVKRPAQRLGTERFIGLALLGIAIGVAVRSLPNVALLWVGTAVLGAGIALGNVLLPPVVRRDYAARAAMVVGSYSAVMGSMAAIASGIALPVAVALNGSWRWSLAIWLVPAFAASIIWLARRPAPAPRAATPSVATAASAAAAPAAGERRPVWRTAAAWRLTIYMGLQSTSFYVFVAWLPSILADHGISRTVGGWYLFGYQVIGILSGLTVPLVLRRLHRHFAAAAVTVPMIIGTLGLALLPAAAPVWVALVGIGSGASLVMVLSLFSMDADDPAHAAALSGMAQSLGYLLAAAGPVAAGALRDATGSWTPALIGLVIFGCGQATVIVVRPRRTAVG
jgi:MFS transporter, CP family, cyanate transporter